MSEPSTVVLLSSDLMMTSTVNGAAVQSGLEFRTATSPEQLQNSSDDDLIIIDLATPGLNMAQASGALNDRQRKTSIVFGPHVHTDRFEQARAAGFINLLARGRFDTEVGEIIRRFANQLG